MPFPITLRSYLNNPVGKSSASVARRDVIKRDLEKRYYALYKSAKDKFKLKVYIDSQGNYYHHFKIPSEFYYSKGLAYDVVIKFNIPTGGGKLDYTLSRYQLSLFSNSPNFLFTYAYVYNQDGNLIPFLNRKIGQKALTERPRKRNPNEDHGFEKSVYFAILYIRDNPKLINKNALDAKKLIITTFTDKIMSCNQKLKEYKEKKAEYDSVDNMKKRHADMINRAARKTFYDNTSLFRRTDKKKFGRIVPNKKEVAKYEKKHSKKVNLQHNMGKSMVVNMNVKKKKK